MKETDRKREERGERKIIDKNVTKRNRERIILIELGEVGREQGHLNLIYILHRTKNPLRSSIGGGRDNKDTKEIKFDSKNCGL